jgi:hypothetical protein
MYGVHQTPKLDTASGGGEPLIVARVEDSKDVVREPVTLQVRVLEDSPQRLPVNGAEVCVMHRSEHGDETVLSRAVTDSSGCAIADLRISFKQCLDNRFMVSVKHGNITRDAFLTALHRTQSFDVSWPPAYATLRLQDRAAEVVAHEKTDRVMPRSVTAHNRGLQSDATQPDVQTQPGPSPIFWILFVASPLAVVAILLLTWSVRPRHPLRTVSADMPQLMRNHRADGTEKSIHDGLAAEAAKYDVALNRNGLLPASAMGGLPAGQFEALQTVLLATFDRESLRRMLRTKLDVRLDHIAGNGPLTDVVCDVIDWAEREGRIEQLVRQAAAFVPENGELQRFASEFERMHSCR